MKIKKESNFIHCITASYSVIAIITLLLVSGCKKDESADLSALLATVPSDAGVVISANLKAMAEKADLKVKDGERNPAIDKMAGGSEELRQMLEVIGKGESGIKMTSMVIFTESYHSYATGLLDDTDAFKRMVEKQKPGSRFSTQNGVEACGDIAVKGNQFWIGDRNNAVESAIIKGFTTQSERQSYLSNDISEQLLEMDHDIMGVADVNSLLSRSDMSMTNLSVAKLVMGTVFSDPQYLKVSADFNNGEFLMEAAMLNSKCKPAEYLLPKGKISEKAVASLTGSGNTVLAIAIPEQLVEKFKNIGGAMGASMGSILAPFECINGTIAVIIDNFNQPTNFISGLIETNGKPETGLTSLLSTAGLQTRKDGNKLYFHSADAPTGKLNGNQVAPDFKNSFMALAIDGAAWNSRTDTKLPISMFYLFLKEEGGSLKANVKLESLNKKENFLKTLCMK